MSSRDADYEQRVRITLRALQHIRVDYTEGMFFILDTRQLTAEAVRGTARREDGAPFRPSIAALTRYASDASRFVRKPVFLIGDVVDRAASKESLETFVERLFEAMVAVGDVSSMTAPLLDGTKASSFERELPLLYQTLVIYFVLRKDESLRWNREAVDAAFERWRRSGGDGSFVEQRFASLREDLYGGKALVDATEKIRVNVAAALAAASGVFRVKPEAAALAREIETEDEKVSSRRQ